MPATYNGVGTRYVGHSNTDSRPAVCPHCHRNVVLTSYDTRLWFVILFIPIIPLARKRIINQCPTCRRHYVMPLDQWEAGKQLSISGAMEEYRTDPTPEKAIAAHQQLLGYHQTSQAEEFGRTMAGEYADNASVQLYLGDASSHIGRWNDAAGYYRRALDLRPDLPEARIAVAQGLRSKGLLNEARELLDFLEKPGAARVYSAGPLESLANAYQAARQPEPALELYGIVLRELPHAGQHAGFRKRVRQAEKAAGRAQSMLPKRKFTLASLFRGDGGNSRGLVIGGVTAGLLAVAMVAGNFYIRGHRKLHVVNGYERAATVQIAGRPDVQVAAHGEAEVTLPEGRYHAVVTAPRRQEFDFDLEAGYFSRWFSNPAWVLNPGGQSVLMLERAFYSKNNNQPTQFSFATGRNFESYPSVDYAFKELPKSVQVSNGEQTKVLTRLDYYRGNGLDVLRQLVDDKRSDEAMGLYEARLRNVPEEPDLVPLYIAAATKSGHLERAREVLRQGLPQRPVNVAWHRAYQNAVRLKEDGAAQARTEYDALLAAHPDDSMLLYLRGRVCEQRAEAEPYFQRAAKADPKNGWPVFALGYNRALAGDWRGARDLAAKACDLAPKSREMEELFFETRLALNETEALEKEQRDRLAAAPLDVGALRRLTDTLSAANQQTRAGSALEVWCAGVHRVDKRGDWKEALGNVRRHVFYSMGDFAGMERECADDQSEDATEARVEALVEQGELERATRQFDRLPVGEDTAGTLLAISVAGAAKGNARLAADYRARAQKAFEASGSLGAGAAALLARTSAPSLADFDAADLSLELKRLLLTSCALQYRTQAATYARLASTINVSRAFPYHLIQRATQSPPR